MAKFLDKKEQVIDFKLTNYGHHLLSVGAFKPKFYTFLDDNVVYDSKHFGRSAEEQNDIHKRIKQDTPYIESLVLFDEIGKNVLPDTEMNFFPSDITPTQKIPRIDEFRFNSLIGDSFVSEDKQKVPSWKLVSLLNDITSSTAIDKTNTTRIPQINITASYFKKIVDNQDYINDTFNTSDGRDFEVVSRPFADGKVVFLDMKNVMIYLEEANTEVLNENFDIEIFEVQQGSSITGEKLIRKYFQTMEEQIVDGLMVSPNEKFNEIEIMDQNAVENYFYVNTDREIDEQVACKLANNFNKESYYVDLDFNCNEEIKQDLFFDIYGSETEAEICQT